MATSEYINVDAILNLKKVEVDKTLSAAMDKILADFGAASVKELIKSFEKVGYSRAVATTKAREFATAKAMMADPDKKMQAKGAEKIITSAENATIQLAQKQLNIEDMLKRSFEGFIKAGETDGLSEKKKLFSDAEKDYKAIRKLYESDELDEGQKRIFRQATAARGIVEDEIGKKLDETNKLVKDSPKKEANEFKKIFGIKELLTTAEAVSSKKDTEIPVAVLDGAINAAAQMGGPITQMLAGIAKVASAGVKKTYKDAAKTYQNVTMYGGGYSTQVAEHMEGAKTGFTEEHYTKLADQSYMFGARTAFGEIGERQWTGLAFLPNYMQGLMSGASPEELVRLLEADRALAPNDAFFRQYLSMAEAPEEVLGWLNLAEKEKARIGTQEIKEEEIRRRADAAAKIQGSVEDPSFWKGTSAFWAREGQEWGDLARNPGYFFRSKDLREKRRLAKMSDWSEEDYKKAGVPEWAIDGLMRDVKEAEGSGVSEKTRDLLSRQAVHASALTDGGRNTIVNVTLEVDGTTMFEGSQTQKEVLDSNYRFVGGAQ